MKAIIGRPMKEENRIYKLMLVQKRAQKMWTQMDKLRDKIDYRESVLGPSGSQVVFKKLKDELADLEKKYAEVEKLERKLLRPGRLAKFGLRIPS